MPEVALMTSLNFAHINREVLSSISFHPTEVVAVLPSLDVIKACGPDKRIKSSSQIYCSRYMYFSLPTI